MWKQNPGESLGNQALFILFFMEQVGLLVGFVVFKRKKKKRKMFSNSFMIKPLKKISETKMRIAMYVKC